MPAYKKRSDQLLGHLPKDYGQPISRAPNQTTEILGPEAPEWLDGFAREWYDSLRTSGQAVYYTDSDWAMAIVVARGVMDFIRRPSASMLSAVLEGAGDLAVTEGARRRMKIELDRAAGTDDPDAEAGDEEAENWYTKLHSVQTG